MYAQSAIRFTDPFGPKTSVEQQSRRSDHHFLAFTDFTRPPTPPPEMHGGAVTHQSRSGYHVQEHPHQYSEPLPPYQVSGAATSSYLPQEATNAEFGRNGISTQPSSRTMSPAFIPRQTTMDDSHLYSHQKSSTRTTSIAPSFQIPKTGERQRWKSCGAGSTGERHSWSKIS